MINDYVKEIIGIAEKYMVERDKDFRLYIDVMIDRSVDYGVAVIPVDLMPSLNR